MGIMEMSQAAAVALHGARQTKDGAQVKFAPHFEGKDRKTGFMGFLVEWAFRLDNKQKRIALLLQHSCQEKRLPLATPPFFPSVNLE